MEESQGKKNRLQKFYDDSKEAVFGVMQDLLKQRTVGQWFACFLMVVMVFQTITFLFEEKVLVSLHLARVQMEG